jgi:hypothetical protein
MSSLDLFLQNHPALNRAGSQELTRAIWGGIAKEFDALKDQVKVVAIDSANVEKIGGDMLDELMYRFVDIRRVPNESDASRLKLLYLFYRRAKAGSWATPHSIRSAYSYYFPIASVYVLENSVETNLLDEGGFEGFDLGVKTEQFGLWVPFGADVEVVLGVGFKGDKCLKLTGTGGVYQDVAVDAGPVVLSTPFVGSLAQTVQRLSDNFYWNCSTKAWQAGAASLALANTGQAYVVKEAIVTLESSDTIRVTYGPKSAGTAVLLDYLSVGMKPTYPFIKVLVAVAGQSGGFINNWVPGADPVAGTNYLNATFLGQDFLYGLGAGIPTAYYQMILDDIKPAGVKALFEFVGR